MCGEEKKAFAPVEFLDGRYHVHGPGYYLECPTRERAFQISRMVHEVVVIYVRKVQAERDKRIAELETALKPFADVSDVMQQDGIAPKDALAYVTLGACHMAKSVLGDSVFKHELVETWWLNDVQEGLERLSKRNAELEALLLKVRKCNIHRWSKTAEDIDKLLGKRPHANNTG